MFHILVPADSHIPAHVIIRPITCICTTASVDVVSGNGTGMAEGTQHGVAATRPIANVSTCLALKARKLDLTHDTKPRPFVRTPAVTIQLTTHHRTAPRPVWTRLSPRLARWPWRSVDPPLAAYAPRKRLHHVRRI